MMGGMMGPRMGMMGGPMMMGGPRGPMMGGPRGPMMGGPGPMMGGGSMLGQGPIGPQELMKRMRGATPEAMEGMPYGNGQFL